MTNPNKTNLRLVEDNEVPENVSDAGPDYGPAEFDLVADAKPIKEIDVAIEELLRETKASIPSHGTNGNPARPKPSKSVFIALVQDNLVDALGQLVPLGNDRHKSVDVLLGQNMSIIVAGTTACDRDL